MPIHVDDAVHVDNKKEEGDVVEDTHGEDKRWYCRTWWTYIDELDDDEDPFRVYRRTLPRVYRRTRFRVYRQPLDLYLSIYLI